MASYHETSVRKFAAEYPTPNVKRMVAYCEAGTITWTQAYELACKSLSAGIASVCPGTGRSATACDTPHHANCPRNAR